MTATLTRAKWVNTCSASECWSFAGMGVLEQRCAEPAIVIVRVTGYDRAGTARVTNEIIPFGVRAVRAGSHPFALDHLLDHDPAVQAFGIEVVEVRKPLQ